MRERLRDFIRWLKSLPGEIRSADSLTDYILNGSLIQRGVIAGLFLLFVIVFWLVSEGLTSSPVAQINLFSVLTSMMLTAVLILAYLGMVESSREQVKLGERQEKIQEQLASLQNQQTEIIGAEFEPVIEVVGFSTGAFAPSVGAFGMDPDELNPGDVITLDVSNPSQAIATNFSVRLEIDYDSSRQLFGGCTLPAIDDVKSEKWSKKPGAIIRGESSEVRLNSVLGLSDKRAMGECRPFSACLNSIINSGRTTLIRIGVYIVYEDRKGDEHDIPIEGLEFDPSELPDDKNPTFQEVREHSRDIDIRLLSEGLLECGVYDVPPKYH